ncbi:MAG: hypothetical protein HN522_06595 [Flavobacteriales bacterium]|jgi:hypothetical protein|nr:hypothetical protein [Flavobacteriales bacterium]
MKKLYKYYLIVFFPIFSSGQISTFHSGFNDIFFKTDSRPWLKFYNTDSDTLVAPNTDTIQYFSLDSKLFSIGSANKSDYACTYLFSASLFSNFKNKITFTSHFDYLAGNHNKLIKEFQDSLFIFPGFGREKSRLQYNLKYFVNKFITVDFGKGKHFIGNGYRSLMLSAEHSPYPYLKLSTEFGRVKYYNLYTTFLDIQDPNQNRKKHSSIHFLDFSLTENINIGIFEGVLWQAKNENYNRGYDLEYLNPIIFYRPVEFSKHSPDNVLIGGNFNAKIKTTTFYGQVLLDDLNISRQKDRDEGYSEGFFQNKFAYQLGLKSSFKKINLLLEYNQAQPYTYAHKEPMQSYTHFNQALAHPLGANFKELLMLANYSKQKWKFSIKLTHAKVGLDSLYSHYGQNIFVSDFEAQGVGSQYSYGNFNGQGVSTIINTLHTEILYSFKWFDLFGSVFYKNKKSDLLDQTLLWYSVGIRTFPFSTFKDY